MTQHGSVIHNCMARSRTATASYHRSGPDEQAPQHPPRDADVIRLRGWAIVASTLALLPRSVSAHADAATPETIWTAWNPDPLILFGIMLSAWAYLRGTGAIWRRVGRGNGVRAWRVAAFHAGLLAVVVALVAPLDALSAALFSAHMAQHLILILVAAPLFVLAAPLVPVLWALPPGFRRSLARWWKCRTVPAAIWHALTTPLVALALHATAIWVWHLPPLYEGAVRSSLLHATEHASFLLTALLFWWPVFPTGGRRRLNPGLGVLYVFGAAMQSGILGVLMLFSAHAWYDSHSATAAAWNTWLRLAERSALARERAGESWVSGGARLDQDR
jgi:putative membrane protein